MVNVRGVNTGTLVQYGGRECIVLSLGSWGDIPWVVLCPRGEAGPLLFDQGAELFETFRKAVVPWRLLP